MNRKTNGQKDKSDKINEFRVEQVVLFNRNQFLGSFKQPILVLN